MKVCFICSQIAAWGKIGGFGTNTRRLGRALVRAGVDVHVVVPRRAGQPRVTSLDGMTVHGQSLLEVFAGTSLYKQVDADIYHVEEPTIGGFWAQCSMPGRVHLVTSMDPRDLSDWTIELRNATWSRRLKFPVQKIYEDGRLVHRAVRSAHGVYVEAPFLANKTRRVYRLPCAPGVLPKPVDMPLGPFEKAARPLCVFLGRFDPRKRPELFFQLVGRMPDIDFIAVGRAHDASYERYLADRYYGLPNLEVRGFVDPFAGDELSAILARSWVLVHPAAREGLPTAFQEASGHEMAILAFVDPDGYVSRFGQRLATDAGVPEMEAALRGLIDGGLWRERAKAGRAYNLEHHATEVSVAAHLDVYRSHLSERVPMGARS